MHFYVYYITTYDRACARARDILTHNLKLDDVAEAVAFDVAGDTAVISGLGPIHHSEDQIVLLHQHAILRVILNHVALEQCIYD